MRGLRAATKHQYDLTKSPEKRWLGAPTMLTLEDFHEETKTETIPRADMIGDFGPVEKGDLEQQIKQTQSRKQSWDEMVGGSKNINGTSDLRHQEKTDRIPRSVTIRDSWVARRLAMVSQHNPRIWRSLTQLGRTAQRTILYPSQWTFVQKVLSREIYF